LRTIGFGSPGNSGDDAGESGETTVSGNALLISLVPYSGVGRRCETGETVADVAGLRAATG
jgi:hypothetical protein